MAIIGNKNIKEFVGEVVSTKMSRTLVVKIDKVKMHPLYKKRYIRSKKYYAHIPENWKVTEWDIVKIREARPYSKLKRWIFVEIVKKHQE